MFKIFKRASKRRIGLDIQTDVIRLVSLEYSSAWSFGQCAEVFVSGFSVKDGKCNEYAKVVAALMALAEQTETIGASVQIALPSRSVIMKFIKLPHTLNDFDCEMEIETNLAEYLPGVSSAVQFDFVRLEAEGLYEQNILLVATKNEIIDFYCGLVTDAGLIVNAVDVDIYALRRAILFSAQSVPAMAIVEFASDFINVVVLQNSRIIFYEALPVCKTASNPDLLLKIQQCLRVCSAMHHDLQIQKIIFAGILQDTLNAHEYFPNIALETYAGIAGFNAAAKEKSPQYARALGLALWGVQHA